MSSNMEDISGTTTSTEETAAPSSDYPKVQANAGSPQEGAPLGSRPLSVSEVPHHHAADPKNIGESDSEA